MSEGSERLVNIAKDVRSVFSRILLVLARCGTRCPAFDWGVRLPLGPVKQGSRAVGLATPRSRSNGPALTEPNLRVEGLLPGLRRPLRRDRAPGGAVGLGAGQRASERLHAALIGSAVWVEWVVQV